MLRFLPTTRRWALWVFAMALLLKAAVPMLASAAAEVQGKTLVEVCTVYGVKTIALDASSEAPHDSGHSASHGAEHCALGGLLVAAALDAPEASPRVAADAGSLRLAPDRHRPAPRDASAAWVAQLKHGPPPFA